MKKLYWHPAFTNFTATAVFVIFFVSSTFAQQTLEGVVRIKVSEALASHMEGKGISLNANGEVVTGHASLDNLNRQFRVKRFTRVFPHAGKNEAKHRRHGLHLWYEVRTDKTIPVSSILLSYRAENQILKAEPVYKKAVIGSTYKGFGAREINDAFAAALPGPSNDPMLANQWHYHNTGQTGGRPGADIRLIDAWRTETGNKNVVIAVTDEGIQTDHVDLAANMWVNRGEIAGNNADDDNNGYVDDVHGYNFFRRAGKIEAGSHGTHVAGTIAAATNNGLGVAGVAGGSNNGDGVRLMSCVVFLNDSAADGFAEAYVYSADNGAVISQNSWGYMLPDVYESVVLEAIDYFIAEAGRDENGNQTGPMNGGLVIFSAGNDNTDANFYPAFYEPVLAVASSTHKDIKAQYSNFGTWIDITAPGGETYETGREGVLSTLPGNKYGYFMGTSMACPHVSGVAGLVLSRFSRAGFRPEMLRERLLRSVDDIDALNAEYAGKLGTGRMNAALALSQHQPVPPEAVTDLAVAGKDVGEITLTWTSPADKNDFVVAYDLRYSTAPITPSNFNAAKKVTGIPSPKPPGTRETFTVKNLSGGILFYFAIRSVDFEGNISPISNVVSETSTLTPSIVVTPAYLSAKLKTAERSARTISVRNEGKGPLKYTLQEPADENPFYTAAPMTGVVPAGNEEIVRVTFDASGLVTGTYKQNIVIHHNDPGKESVTVPLTLQVTSNGSPIASVSPVKVDFKSVKVGYSQVRSVTIFNEGSDALVVSEGDSKHPAFRTEFNPPLSVPAFSRASVRLIFSPETTGMIEGIVSLHTNDPATPVLEISVRGEGLEEPPIVVSPNSLSKTLEQGTRVTRTMVLQNNGSQDRAYRLETKNNRRTTGESALAAPTASGRRVTKIDSTQIKRQILEKHQREFGARPHQQKGLLEAIGTSAIHKKSSDASGRKSHTSVTGPEQYVTGFEEFTTGALDEQNGWHATNSWGISEWNPDRGALHLRGTSEVSGTGQKYVVSPYLFEDYEYPHYTTTTMRINADHAKGATWQVVPQDPWSYVATRIRFNADGTIDALVIDNDYAFHWKRVPVARPSGYFELAIEYNNWGSDTSGFPTYYLFINSQHVFSGTGLASGIGQVAFTSPMETTGPVFDVDEFKLTGDEYIPQFVTANPVEGVIPAGRAVDVAVGFDATLLKTGNYEADIVLHIDATDTVAVPVALTVTGRKILMEKWTGISGTKISSIPVNTPPDSTVFLSIFESPSNTGDHYGTRIRGYVEAPASGYYTFWIASNDKSELWLGTDESATTKKKIASVTGYTNPRQWDKYPTQKSGQIYLVANRRYYIEALHKEGVGTDHVAVGWQLPDHAMERPIPGMRLFRYAAETFNEPPQVTILSPAQGEIFSSPAAIQLEADARDGDGHIVKVEFFNSETKLGEDAAAPYSFSWTNVPAGTYQLTATATDDGGSTTVSQAVRITVEAMCTASGNITREYWTGISGNLVSYIPLHTPPDGVKTLAIFEGPVNAGINYGARIRGFICPPQTGNYHFWISSNDHSELWLSTDEDPENRMKIAFLTRATDVRQWDKFTSQRSQAIPLVQGRAYYIEALHKQGVGTDHAAVGWQLPDGTMELPITGDRLSPFVNDAGDLLADRQTRVPLVEKNNGESQPLEVSIYPNPLKGEMLNIAIENLPQTESVVREIEIRQLTGLSVFSEKTNCNGDCNAAIEIRKHMPSGVYLVQVKINGRISIQKLAIP